MEFSILIFLPGSIPNIPIEGCLYGGSEVYEHGLLFKLYHSITFARIMPRQRL